MEAINKTKNQKQKAKTKQTKKKNRIIIRRKKQAKQNKQNKQTKTPCPVDHSYLILSELIVIRKLNPRPPRGVVAKPSP